MSFCFPNDFNPCRKTVVVSATQGELRSDFSRQFQTFEHRVTLFMELNICPAAPERDVEFATSFIED